MLLVVDVGNTNTVLGLYDGEQLVHDFRIETAKGRTIDECQVLLLNLLQLAGVKPTEVRASILASVVPSFNDIIIDAVDRAFDHEIMIVGPGIKTGMPVLYENPREVGADRIVISCKMSRVPDLVEVYQALAPRWQYALHLGLTEAGMGDPGIIASSAALAIGAAR